MKNHVESHEWLIGEDGVLETESLGKLGREFMFGLRIWGSRIQCVGLLALCLRKWGRFSRLMRRMRGRMVVVVVRVALRRASGD